MTKKRKIEVFTAGCPLCDETVKLVEALSCPSCEVEVLRMNEGGLKRARELGVKAVPSVAVNGRLLECCRGAGPTRESLIAAGLGAPL